MVMSAEHRSKCAAFHRQWWLFYISEKFSNGTKKNKECFNSCLRIATDVVQIEQKDLILFDESFDIKKSQSATSTWLFLIFADNTQSLLEENRQLKDLRMCKICMENEASVAMLPCGHLCCCTDCAPAMRKCPICRQFVKGTVRTWLAWLYLFVINYLDMIFLFVL